MDLIKPSVATVWLRSSYIAGGETLLKSWVGSWAYAAPEIWEGSPYTQAVDVEYLAVVILQYSYSLPTPNRGNFNAQDWHKRIIKVIRATVLAI